MGIRFAQEIQIMRCKIDDQQPPTRSQDAGGFANGRLRVAEEVQHLMHDHGTSRRVRDVEVVEIPMPHLGRAAPGGAASQPRRDQVGPCKR